MATFVKVFILVLFEVAPVLLFAKFVQGGSRLELFSKTLDISLHDDARYIVLALNRLGLANR